MPVLIPSSTMAPGDPHGSSRCGAAGGGISDQTSQQYTADDWQAQLEEVLALQAIYAEDFR